MATVSVAIGPRMLQRVLKMQIAPEFPASVALHFGTPLAIWKSGWSKCVSFGIYAFCGVFSLGDCCNYM